MGMNIKLTYRPMAGIAIITNTQAQDIDEYDQYFYPESDSYCVSVASVECDDHTRMLVHLTIIDFYNEGSSWSVWASEWLSDQTINSIYDLVNGWHDHWADTMINADTKTKALTKYETYLDTATAS